MFKVPLGEWEYSVQSSVKKRLILPLCLGGIVFSIILGLLGLTGSLQAYYYELDEWLNPQFYNTSIAGTPRHPADLIDILETRVPGARVWYMEQPKAVGRSVMMAVEPIYDAQTKTYAALPYNYYYMDPVTTEVVGARTWGACCFEPENLMNFTYELHRTLMLPGAWGLYITGAGAILWSFGCLYILVHALFKRRPIAALRTGVRASAFLAVCMLPVAISGVALNLSNEVFRPVVSFFSPVKPTIYGEYAAKNTTDFGPRTLSYRDAYDRGIKIGKANGWRAPVGEFFYSDLYNFYGLGYGLRDPKSMGNIWVFISAVDGSIIRTRSPYEGTNGEIFTEAQLPLHSGRINGSISQFYIFLIGLIVTWLSWRLGRTCTRKLLP